MVMSWWWSQIKWEEDITFFVCVLLVAKSECAYMLQHKLQSYDGCNMVFEGLGKSTVVEQMGGKYCKFTVIRSNFIFANFHEFDPSRIQDSHKTFVYIEFTHRACHSLQILIQANWFMSTKLWNIEHTKIK